MSKTYLVVLAGFGIILIICFSMLIRNQEKIQSNQAEFRQTYAKIQKTLDERSVRFDQIDHEIMELRNR